MLWLIGLGAAAVALFAFGSSQKKEGSEIKAWDIMLQSPAAISQAAIGELIAALGMSRVRTAFLATPQPGYTVLHIETDTTPPPVGKSVSVQGVPFRVMAVNLAPVG